ncbi:MAG TPA: substrate-binding domain-containing protein [Thermoanaerobaculia bacterium]|nr:substrate-binding domain-containing protein [Thermoanaerobaculia bacterium]
MRTSAAPRIAAVAVAAVLAFACRTKEKEPAISPAAASAPAAKPTKKLTIAVIPQGTTYDFWKSIHAGAVKASRDLAAAGTPVEVIWKGPLREDDREQQVQVVEGFITQKVDGIVLAPFDRNALARPVDEAAGAGIPVVIIDTAVESPAPISVVASDNHRGGELAADELARILHEKGKVILLRFQEGVASTEAREKGFEERMRSAHAGVQIVSSNQHAGATRETAKTAAENLLNRFADVDGIFAPNESSAVGTLLALEDSGRAGKVHFIGFDTSPDFVPAMRAGKLDGIIVQNPFGMGELGVKTMVRHLNGEAVDKRIDTGVTLVTPANLDSPESQRLLSPPLDEYLK